MDRTTATTTAVSVNLVGHLMQSDSLQNVLSVSKQAERSLTIGLARANFSRTMTNDISLNPVE